MGQNDMKKNAESSVASTLYSHISRASLSQVALLLTLFVVLFQSSLAIAKGDLNQLLTKYLFMRYLLALFVLVVGLGCIYSLYNWNLYVRLLEKVAEGIRYDDNTTLDTKIKSIFQELASEGNKFERWLCRKHSKTHKGRKMMSFYVAVSAVVLFVLFDIVFVLGFLGY